MNKDLASMRCEMEAWMTWIMPKVSPDDVFTLSLLLSS